MKILKKITFFIVLILIFESKAENTLEKYYNLNDSIFTIGSIMILPNIYYSMDDWFNWQYEPLDSIVLFLEKHPNLTVEISYHTDIRPITMTNDTLSKIRANGIVDYIISKGISSNRLVAVGYGSNRPRCLEKDYTTQYGNMNFTFEKGICLTPEFILNLSGRNHIEAAHSLNRRAEMKIIKIE